MALLVPDPGVRLVDARSASRRARPAPHAKPRHPDALGETRPASELARRHRAGMATDVSRPHRASDHAGRERYGACGDPHALSLSWDRKRRGMLPHDGIRSEDDGEDRRAVRPAPVTRPARPAPPPA